jgi:hypothetical protein
MPFFLGLGRHCAKRSKSLWQSTFDSTNFQPRVFTSVRSPESAATFRSASVYHAR